MKLISICCLGLISIILAGSLEAPSARQVSSQHLRLLPVPAQITAGEGRLVINQGFRVALQGYQDTLIKRAVGRFIVRLRRQTGFELTQEILSKTESAALTISCGAAGEAVQSIKADESYRLDVSREKALLSAASPAGVLRGLETFLQLVDINGELFGVPAVTINDRPRFAWRGLLIDVGRHWHPVEVIKRNLDAMAAVKLNVLHWHLSEDQGFRVESRVHPKLHEMGSDGNYYTQEQVREIVAYARDRGIRVVPEFDMPGHTTAWFVGYPSLAAAPGPYQIQRRWGVFEPTMDPTKEELYKFIDSFIGEMSRLFPDEYFHIGGDEVEGKQWTASPRIQAFKKKNKLPDNHALQAYFNRRLLSILARHGKKMVGWDEILHPDLPANVVIQSWRGQKSLAEAAHRGFKGILSSGYYLDHVLPAAFHYQVDPLDKEAAGLSPQEKANVLGGEACMWSEYVTQETIDSRIWPRCAAVAERLWSPADVRDVPDMYRRLSYLSRDLDALGVTHLSGRAHMLQRLAGNNPVEPVRTLSDILEPIKYLRRGSAQHYTSQTPMNRMVDATPPESDVARQFGLEVEQALANRSGNNFRTLREQLTRWRDNDGKLKPIIEDSFLLKEIAPLSETLRDLATAGLQALDSLESGKAPAENWQKERAAIVERAKKPQAELLIMIVPAIQKLVEAAGVPLNAHR